MSFRDVRVDGIERVCSELAVNALVQAEAIASAEMRHDG